MSTLVNNLLAEYYVQQQDEVPPDNEVWYWANEQVTLYTQTGVVSHVFADGKGVVTFNAPVTTMGQAFRLVTTTTKMRLPKTVTAIGDAAFVNGQFTSINIPNVVEVSNVGFQNCTRLAISLPKKLVNIGNSAFSTCSSLRASVIPAGVKSIGASAFRLSSASFTAIPYGLEYIGPNAFQSSRCSFNVIPASVQHIGSSAFVSLNMPELTFMGTPQYLDAGAFNQLSSLTLIRVPWSEGEVANAPWGATNATIIYNYQP